VSDLIIRSATADDAETLHALIATHQAEGHLLPRPLDEVRRHAAGFVVGDLDRRLVACAELAPLSPTRAEIRSLVVARDLRRIGVAARLVNELRTRATAAGFRSLFALTHDARFFIGQNFSIVPHVWLPEKIAKDCHGCSLFRQCGQQAMVLDLKAVARFSAAKAFLGRRVAVA
jgi:N-acetylglutamate synthase-like GNAT family acetyltransferase